MELLTGKTLRKSDGSGRPSEVALADKNIVCFYFSAHWCPPCRQFTQVLKEFYEEVQGQGLEIVFVSSDRSPEDMTSYMTSAHGDWLSVEHGSDTAQALKQKYSVSGIPCLVVVRKADGSLITKDGRSAVQSKGPMALKEWA